MKITIYLLIIFASFSAVAQETVNSSISGKVGAAYADDPNKFGLQLSAAYTMDIDQFFAIGFESSFVWAKWRQNIADITTGSGISGSVVRDTDAYMFPLIVFGQVRFANFQKSLHGVLPYINAGLGYSAMSVIYDNQDGNQKSDYFGGFTWEAALGASFSPGESSKVEFLGEAGFRSAPLKNSDNIEISMSGVFFNAGVKYPF